MSLLQMLMFSQGSHADLTAKCQQHDRNTNLYMCLPEVVGESGLPAQSIGTDGGAAPQTKVLLIAAMLPWTLRPCRRAEQGIGLHRASTACYVGWGYVESFQLRFSGFQLQFSVPNFFREQK